MNACLHYRRWILRNERIYKSVFEQRKWIRRQSKQDRLALAVNIPIYNSAATDDGGSILKEEYSAGNREVKAYCDTRMSLEYT